MNQVYSRRSPQIGDAVRPAQLELLALVEDVLLQLLPVVVAAGDDLLHEGVEIVLGRHGAERKAPRRETSRRARRGSGSSRVDLIRRRPARKVLSSASVARGRPGRFACDAVDRSSVPADTAVSGTRLADVYQMSMRMFLFAVLTSLAVAAQAAESPLIVSDLVTGEASHVRITNTGRQPVTAWSLAATTEAGARAHAPRGLHDRRLPERGDPRPAREPPSGSSG